MTIIYLQGLRLEPQPRNRGCVQPRPRSRTRLQVTAQDGTVEALGEVDAANAKSFSDQVCAAISAMDDAVGEVTVDLSGVRFFAVDACTALHAVNAHLMRVDRVWSVVPGPAVSRVLGLCDPASVIPVADSEELAEPA